ncbi:MAG: hypothetical protein V1844_25275 [Pseudomonadota bacterium]
MTAEIDGDALNNTFRLDDNQVDMVKTNIWAASPKGSRQLWIIRVALADDVSCSLSIIHVMKNTEMMQQKYKNTNRANG